MGGSSNSSNPNRSSTTRYAPYIEEKHTALLTTVASTRANIITDSPYSSYVDQDVNTGILGVGYTIADFPALYDMFGKYMSGFNIEVLWERVFNTQMQREEIDGTIQAQLAFMNDNVVQTIPEFKLSMRDLNGVNSSSFIIGKANIEQDKIKKLARISADTKFKILPTIANENAHALNWRKNTIVSYAELMKFYYLTTGENEEINTDFTAQNLLWPFYVLDFERAVLGTLQGAASFQKTMGKRERSNLSKVFLVASYTAQGAGWGTMIGGPGWGTAIGAVVGFIVGVAIVMSE